MCGKTWAVAEPGLNRDRFLLQRGLVEFRRNEVHLLVNKELLQEMGSGGRGRWAVGSRGLQPSPCKASLTSPGSACGPGCVASLPAGGWGQSPGSTRAAARGLAGAEGPRLHQALRGRWPPSCPPALIRGRGPSLSLGMQEEAGLPGRPRAPRRAVRPRCPSPQAGVGDEVAGDAGPPLRHAVLGGPRGALHVRAHPQGPHLVLLW